MTSAVVDADAVTVRVPGKVNLELRVGPPRADGYHSLATVYQAVSLYDEVTVEYADEWGVSILGPTAAGVPADGTNLAVRAARLLSRQSAVDEPVHITIRKEIPVAGGMAGGSADAAGALVACDSLWGLGMSREELEKAASELGSDAPFLVAGGTAMGSGRGELLAPVLARGTFHWVLALSPDGLSTTEIYATCDRLRSTVEVPEPTTSTGLMAALRSGDPRALAASIGNDLQLAATTLRPELQGVLDAGTGFGALAGIVSGSGPTVAFLVDGAEGAIDLAVSLTASGTASEVRRATGPVHGATLVATPHVD
jgi:4-diphosphocytidyl-2-C-methyl-D-erythritol kinase